MNTPGKIELVITSREEMADGRVHLVGEYRWRPSLPPGGIELQLAEILALFVQDWDGGTRRNHYEIERRLRELAGLPPREG